jgi:hypothetical protein
MNFNKRIKSNNNYSVYHERRRAARNNVDQNLNDDNSSIKRENKISKELKDRKHVLNLKLKKLKKIKKEKQYKYQSSNLSEKSKIRKKFERENKRIKEEIRNINDEKQLIIRLRELNNRLVNENKDIKAKLEESKRSKNRDRSDCVIQENIVNRESEHGILNCIIQYLRKWLTML